MKSSQRNRVLARLEQGPATNVDLNQVCFRYGARILELREAGYSITTEQLDRSLFLYSLAAPPAAGAPS